MTQTTPRDHPIVKAWIEGAHAVVEAGGSFQIRCVVMLKNGKNYGMPLPPSYIAPHVKENGTVTYGETVVPSFMSV